MDVSSNENNFLDKETNKLIKNKEILIKEKDIKKYKVSFRKILITKELLDNFRTIGFFLGIMLACIFLILVYFFKKNKSALFIFTMLCIALAIIIFIGFLGSKLSKKKKIIVIEKIIDYVFKRLVKWTFSRLNLTKPEQLNKRRCLIENLMINYYEFVNFKELEYKNDFQRSIFESIFNDKNNIKAIKISLKLLRILFTQNNKYIKNALKLFENIYMPIVYLSINDEINNLINLEKEKFELDTKIKILNQLKNKNLYDFFEMNFKKNLLDKKLNKDFKYDQEKNGSFFDKSSKVIIDRNIFNKSEYVFTLFQDLWRVSHVYNNHDWNTIKYSPFNSLNHSLKVSLKNITKDFESSLKNIKQDFETNPLLIENNKKNIQLEKKKSNEIIQEEVIVEKEIEKHDIVLQNLLDVKSAPTHQFKTILEKKNIKIFKKIDKKDPVILVKSITQLKHKPENVYELLFNLEIRAKWDRIFSKWEIKKIIDENTDVIYSYIKAPFIVTDREFLQKRLSYKNIIIENEKFDYIIAFGNYNSNEFPVSKNIIRADTKVSGYIMKKIVIDGKEGTELTMISKTDIKGLIPKSLVSHHAKKKPVSWAMNFEKALEKHSKK